MPNDENGMASVSPKADLQRQKVRTLCSFYYDLQSERIRTGNRIVASLRPDLVHDMECRLSGSAADTDTDDRKAAELLKACLEDYHLLHDQYAESIKTRASLQKTIDRLGPELGAIKSSVDMALVQVYDHMCSMESDVLKELEHVVRGHPMYDAFFSRIPGCGTLVSAICLSYIDVHKCRHASALWRYTGLDTVLNPETGEMEGRCRKHRVEQEYVDRDGNVATRMGLGYNPTLKTKVCEILVSGVLKAYGGKVARVKKLNESDGGNRPLPQPDGYAKVYYDYKNRLDNRLKTKDYTAAHKHRMAARYMAKIFLQDLWNQWRVIEGYPPDPSYAVAKLGFNPHGKDFKPVQKTA